MTQINNRETMEWFINETEVPQGVITPIGDIIIAMKGNLDKQVPIAKEVVSKIS